MDEIPQYPVYSGDWVGLRNWDAIRHDIIRALTYFRPVGGGIPDLASGNMVLTISSLEYECLEIKNDLSHSIKKWLSDSFPLIQILKSEDLKNSFILEIENKKIQFSGI